MKKEKTGRGFVIYKFKDNNECICSLQKSSSALEDKVWLGIDDADPKIMASQAHFYGIKTLETTGWISYPIPTEVLLSTRMHLTQSQAKQIVKVLNKFIETGDI